MKVEMIDSMGNDLTVVNAARVSYGKHTDTLREQDKRLIAYLAKNGIGRRSLTRRHRSAYRPTSR